MMLIPDWRVILRKAWSTRLWAAALAVDLAGEVLPYFSGSFDEFSFRWLSIALGVGGIIMRFVSQENCK